MPRIPLNPADTFFYALHRAMAGTDQHGYVAMMTTELDAWIPPDAMADALQRLLLAHPVLMARMRFSLLGRPYWQLPKHPQIAVAEALPRIHESMDLREEPDAIERADVHMNIRYSQSWKLRRGPQIKLQQYLLPDERTRLVLRWPHQLMDGAGAMWLFYELNRLGSTDELDPESTELPEGLAPGTQLLDPLAGLPLGQKWRLFKAGLKGDPEFEGKKAAALFDKPQPLGELRVRHLVLEPDKVEAMRARGRQVMPAGRGRHARFMAICVLRALHRIYTERNIESDGYVITMPVNMVHESEGEPRPMQGNYLVSPILWGRRELADDPTALAEDLAAQLERYHADSGPLKQWAMLWGLSKLPAFIYIWLLKQSFKMGSMSSGFSYYGENSTPVRSILGAELTNMWGAGPVPTPPGWNPAFAKFDDKLNISLSWPRPAIDDGTAARFLQLIRQEALGDE